MKNLIFDDPFYTNGQDQDVFWWNHAFEAVEASEVAEANEFNKAVEVLRLEKSFLKTSESSRFLNSALFDVKKN